MPRCEFNAWNWNSVVRNRSWCFEWLNNIELIYATRVPKQLMLTRCFDVPKNSGTEGEARKLRLYFEWDQSFPSNFFFHDVTKEMEKMSSRTSSEIRLSARVLCMAGQRECRWLGEDACTKNRRYKFVRGIHLRLVITIFNQLRAGVMNWRKYIPAGFYSWYALTSLPSGLWDERREILQIFIERDYKRN